jgi:hypothetical protein
MSITPVDKPPDGDGEPDSSLDGRSSRVREYVGRFFSWLGARVFGAGSRSNGREGAQSGSQVGSPDGTAVEAEPVDSIDNVAFDDFPERARPLTHPARNGPGINTPDVVSIETDQGLRLSVPENPDAELTSDVWMPVEP